MSKIEHTTLNDRAYLALKRGLISGAFRPGQPLVIRTMAESYGISTTPVREALQRLVAERLLVMQPNRSIAVPLLSIAKFTELYRVRCALEGLAAELAAAHIQAKHLQRLEKLLQEIETTIAERDSRGYLSLNEKFHFLIYERAESPLLLELIQDRWSQVGPFFNELFEDTDYLPHANEHHVKIVAALRAGDAGGVRQSIIDDISTAAHSMMPRLREVVSVANGATAEA
ncbi:MAG: GntR family transcriptional regulator [Bauldia sp.]|nr:GntR family transcriptional regulator [Bauldia sp.]